MIEFFVQRFQFFFKKVSFLINKIIYPNFLTSLEPHYLLNHPKLWEIRFLVVFYHVFLFVVLVIPFVFFVPIEPHQAPTIWIYLGIILGIQLLIYRAWTRKALLYNLEKDYGNSNPKHGWIELELYLLCTGLLLSSSYFSFFVFQDRLANTIENIDLESFNNSYQAFLSSFDSSEPSTCEEAIRNANVSTSTYQFIEQFSGKTILTNEAAVENYCLAASNAITAYNLLSSNGHQNTWNFFHFIFLLYGACFIFACKHVWQSPSDVFFLPFVYLFLGFATWAFFSIIGSLFDINIYLYVKDVDLTIPILVWSFSAIILSDVILINKLEKYSSISAYSVTISPICLILSFLMVTYVFPSSSDLIFIITSASVMIWLVLVPFLKAKYLRLLSLPIE